MARGGRVVVVDDEVRTSLLSRREVSLTYLLVTFGCSAPPRLCLVLSFSVGASAAARGYMALGAARARRGRG